MVQDQILPAVALMRQYGDTKPSTSDLLANFPLGFTTGDAEVDQAATVLRALYVRDLRELQTQIDDVVEGVQAVTANPKTTVGGEGSGGGKRSKT